MAKDCPSKDYTNVWTGCWPSLERQDGGQSNKATGAGRIAQSNPDETEGKHRNTERPGVWLLVISFTSAQVRHSYRTALAACSICRKVGVLQDHSSPSAGT